LIPVTWIVLLATPTVPPGQSVVEYPCADPVVEGADQPPGTATVNWPAVIVSQPCR